MSKKQKAKMEYRYYDMPVNHPVLALLGDKWKQNYGRDIDYLHYHNLFEIGYCYEGDGILTLQDQDLDYKGNMFTLIPKDYPHTTNSKGDNICNWEWLFFDAEKIICEAFKDNLPLMERLLVRINKNAHLIKVEDEPQMASLIQLLIETMRKRADLYLEEAQGLVLALFMEIARYNKGQEEDKKNAPPDNIITPALLYIRENYNKQIKIQELAAVCHISETHFRRIFVENMNVTPVEYINYVRINAACDLLKRTNDSVSSIALRTGFVSLATFNRNFQKIIGISPQKWRNNGEHFVRKILEYDVKIQEGW